MENVIVVLFGLWAVGAMCFFVTDLVTGGELSREVIIGPHQLEFNFND